MPEETTPPPAAPAAGDGDAERLRVLIAAPYPPSRDARHGGGRVVAQLATRLAARHEVALAYLSPAGAPPLDSELAERCAAVERVETGVPQGGASRTRERLALLAAPLTGAPSGVSLIDASALERACVELAARWRPDVVQVEHDLIASCGPALARAAVRAPRILVCHEPGLRAAQELAGSRAGRRRLAHRLDAVSWRRHLKRTLPSFDAVVAFTEDDRAAIEAEVTVGLTVTIPIGTEIPERALSAAGRGERPVLFVGGYRHPPNADAALRLIRAIMPIARRRLPELSLVVVGADPTAEMVAAAGPADRVTGAVDSIEPHLDRAGLMALPLRLGGGMRVKLLEALAAGKAVVASPVAAAGLGVADGVQLVLADTDEEFAAAIVRLMSDDAVREDLGRRARHWASRNLSWEERVFRYERLYRSLLETAPPAVVAR